MGFIDGFNGIHKRFFSRPLFFGLTGWNNDGELTVLVEIKKKPNRSSAAAMKSHTNNQNGGGKNQNQPRNI